MTTSDAGKNSVSPDDDNQSPDSPDLTIVDAWKQVVAFEEDEKLEASRLPYSTLEFSEE